MKKLRNRIFFLKIPKVQDCPLVKAINKIVDPSSMNNL